MNESYENAPVVLGRLIVSLVSASSVAGLSTLFTPVWGLWFWVIFLVTSAISFFCLCIFGARARQETEAEWRG